MTNDITIAEIISLLKERERIIIISHVRPDGDTLACAYALGSILTNMGKKVLYISSDRVSERLKFLCKEPMLLPDEIPSDFKADLIVSVDVASVSMLGNCKDIIKMAESVKIDHHVGDNCFADHNYTEPKSASCSGIIYGIANELTDNNMPFEVCELLYAGISFDTGCFKHSNVTHSTHEKAAYLVSRGVDTSDINAKLFGNKTKKEISALKLAYNSLEFFEDGKVAIVCITNEMKNKYDLNDDDVSDLAQIPIEIEGVLLGITLKEKGDAAGNFKVSMRSKPGVDAGNICRKLGGGGHVCAAGGLVIADNKDEATNKVLDAAKGEI